MSSEWEFRPQRRRPEQNGRQQVVPIVVDNTEIRRANLLFIFRELAMFIPVIPIEYLVLEVHANAPAKHTQNLYINFQYM